MEIRFSSSFLSVHAHVCVCKLTWWGRLSQLKHSHSKWLCLQILSLRPPVINHWSTVLHVASDHNWSSHTLMSVCTRHWRNYPLTDALIPHTENANFNPTHFPAGCSFSKTGFGVYGGNKICFGIRLVFKSCKMKVYKNDGWFCMCSYPQCCCDWCTLKLVRPGECVNLETSHFPLWLVQWSITKLKHFCASLIKVVRSVTCLRLMFSWSNKTTRTRRLLCSFGQTLVRSMLLFSLLSL